MSARTKWIVGIIAVALFFWLDSNPFTAPILNDILGWVVRAVIVLVAYGVSSTAFQESRSPRQTAWKAAGVVIGLSVFAWLTAGCDCDPDDPFTEEGCSWICEDVTRAERGRAAGLVLIMVGGPMLAAAIRYASHSSAKRNKEL